MHWFWIAIAVAVLVSLGRIGGALGENPLRRTMESVNALTRARVADDLRRFMCLAISILAAVSAALVTLFLLCLPAMRTRAREGSTEANMHIVQLAAEDFAVKSGGVFAGNVDRLVDLLPLHERIWNAFTERKTEPRQGPAPLDPPPGSVWYKPVRDYSGAVVGYEITGFGKSGRLRLVLEHDSASDP
jgi:hypothetical protein